MPVFTQMAQGAGQGMAGLVGRWLPGREQVSRHPWNLPQAEEERVAGGANQQMEPQG